MTREADNLGMDANEIHWVVRPLFLAGAIAGIYVLLSSIYVAVSTLIVEQYSLEPHELEMAELTKGTIFVVVTSILFFMVSWLIFRRLSLAERETMTIRAAMMTADRRATVGVFASTIAHDINNILGVVGAGIDELASGEPANRAAREHTVEQLEQAVAQISSLTRGLMSAGRESVATEFSVTDISPLVRHTVSLVRSLRRISGCSMTVETEGSIIAKVNSRLVQQLLVNLILNAADATEQTGSIRVLTRREGNSAAIEVHDNGPGIAREHREKIFDPFYTTKKHGSGLGLIAVKACVQAHKGAIEVAESPLLGGACFRVLLPLSA